MRSLPPKVMMHRMFIVPCKLLGLMKSSCSLKLSDYKLKLQTFFSKEQGNPAELLQYTQPPSIPNVSSSASTYTISNSSSHSSRSSFLFSSDILSSAAPTNAAHNGTTLSDLISSMSQNDRPFTDSTSLFLSTMGPASLFLPQQHQFIPLPSSSSQHMSTTALLQKAAQVGPAVSGSSFLEGFGLDFALGHIKQWKIAVYNGGSSQNHRSQHLCYQLGLV